jgi:hypothetical protein
MKFENNLGHTDQVREDQQLNSFLEATDHEDQTLEGCIEFQIIINFIDEKLCLHLI